MPISYSLAPLSASVHPATDLLHKLSSQGFTTDVRYPWSLKTIQDVILQVPHVSTKTEEDIYFYREEFVERVGCGFSILLSTADDVSSLAIVFASTIFPVSPRKPAVTGSSITPRRCLLVTIPPSPSPSSITTSLVYLLLGMSTPVPINLWHQLPCILVLTFPVSSIKYGRQTHPMAWYYFISGTYHIYFIDSS